MSVSLTVPEGRANAPTATPPRYRFERAPHVHYLDERPLMGASSVVQVISKQLTYWAAGLAVAELGWTPINNPATKKPIPRKERLALAAMRWDEVKRMDLDEYLKTLDTAYRAHKTKLDKTAKVGTDMHFELERYTKFCIAENGGIPVEKDEQHVAVQIFRDWALGNVKKLVIAEGHCYHEGLWIGGICDLLFLDKKGRLGIMDFKSSREAYLSQFIQTAGYDLAASENGLLTSTGMVRYKLQQPISYYAVFPFGAEKPEPQFNYDTYGCREGFKAALTLHKLMREEAA